MVLMRTLLTATTVVLAALPAWSAGAPITFTLNGKPVTSVPVDQLGSLTVTVDGGKPFKTIYAGQWGGTGQSLGLRATFFPKGSSIPDVSGSPRWALAQLTATSLDSGWAAKSTTNLPMYDAAVRMRLHEADTTHNLVFTARFDRQDFTGKTVWKDGGWVQEKFWQTLGVPIGAAVLQLDPPRSAGSLNAAAMFAAAAKSQDKAKMAAKDLLDESGDYGGTAIAKVEARAGKPIAYSWNYNDQKQQLVYAKIPVNVTLHATVSGIRGQLPGAAKTADFVCPMVVSAKQIIGGAWTFDDLEFGSELREQSRTTDGRTADQIKSSMDPASVLKSDPNQSQEEQALDLIKKLGF